MFKAFRPLALAVLLVLAIGPAALAVTFPTVQYIGFEPLTYTYTYKVTQPAVSDCEYALDSFEIDGMMPIGTSYTMTGPFVGSPTGENMNWSTRPITYPPYAGVRGYEWWAEDGEDQIWPGMYLEEDWIGYFKLTVPNSRALANGTVITRQLGELASENPTTEFTVPNPIPEPAGLAVFASMAAFVAPALLRRRR